MSNKGFFGIAAYGAAPPLNEWPREMPTTPEPFDGEVIERMLKAARFPIAPAPMPATAAEIVREQIERLVRLRLSPALTDDAARADLDAIIGALTVAVSMP